MINKIFIIMGLSNTGKSVILNKILEKNIPNLIRPIQYTTRPARYGEIDGEEYKFITESDMKRFDCDDIIDPRSYEIVNQDGTKGMWRYFHHIDSFDTTSHKKLNYILINSYIGYDEFFMKYKTDIIDFKDFIVPINIVSDDKIRLQRAIERESKSLSPNYNEVCARYLRDNETLKYSTDIINNVHTFTNNSKINIVVTDIVNYINDCITENFSLEEKKAFYNTSLLPYINNVMKAANKLPNKLSDKLIADTFIDKGMYWVYSSDIANREYEDIRDLLRMYNITDRYIHIDNINWSSSSKFLKILNTIFVYNKNGTNIGIILDIVRKNNGYTIVDYLTMDRKTKTITNKRESIYESDISDTILGIGYNEYSVNIGNISYVSALNIASKMLENIHMVIKENKNGN